MYRSVVAQQGRATVEADTNEAEEIRSVDARAALIDIIGPSGTPDDGFRISVPGGANAFDFAIGEGSLYVGGVHLRAPARLTYVNQKDSEWVDYPGGAPSDPPTPKAPFTEIVFLRVTEQEVSAVEDPALKEVALGGPDTAARTRMIQRVHRAPMTGTSSPTPARARIRVSRRRRADSSARTTS
jgi:hypothetical protein